MATTAISSDMEINLASNLLDIAVSESDLARCGCPHCGYAFGYEHRWGQKTMLWACKNNWCQKSCLVLARGVAQATISFNGGTYLKLQEHPRKDIAKSKYPHPNPREMSREDLEYELTEMQGHFEKLLEKQDICERQAVALARLREYAFQIGQRSQLLGLYKKIADKILELAKI